MNDEERDIKIIETANDVRWLKEWAIEHKSAHFKYQVMLWAVAIGLVVQYLR